MASARSTFGGDNDLDGFLVAVSKRDRHSLTIDVAQDVRPNS
jgi:hypothetical protein